METPVYHKNNPFFASVRERYFLSKPGSQKKTQHLVLDIRGSGITYEVGDSFGVFPTHDPALIEKTLRAMQAKGDELITPSQSSEKISLYRFLAEKANITTVSPKLFKEVASRQTNCQKKEKLEQLSQDEHRAQMKDTLDQHEVWDFLEEHCEVHFSPQELAALLMPLLPRFYSISASQKYVGDEVHITVAPVDYETNGHRRRGVCSHFLCELAPLNEQVVPIFIQPSHAFHLPEDHHSSMIMVGPGTGVAPFRAFMQERFYHHRSEGKHWLFFGEWNSSHDFFYQRDWEDFSSRGHLQVDCAFSRDQQEKIYVQHRMLEKGEEFFRWLDNGAYLYVCGDAQQMAKDVDAALLTVIQTYGNRDLQSSRDYVKQLRQQKRYRRDVY